MSIRRSLPVAAVLGLALAAPGAAAGAKFFHSPSGNIGCGISLNGARCDIAGRDWRPPPKPAGCRLDWGYGLTLGPHGRGRFFCASDSLLGIGAALRYGRSIRRGRFKCVSRTDGVRCVNRRTHHGFRISRQRALRF